MIFLTVGTVMPFDRLVKAVDSAVEAGVIDEPVFAQIGQTSCKPKNIEYAEVLGKKDFDRRVTDSSSMISHAGIGSICMALEQRKAMLVMPRRRCYREHVNDHQVDTARKFGSLGHVLVAYSPDELREKLPELSHFVPVSRTNQVDRVVQRIASFLEGDQAGSPAKSGVQR